VLGEHFTLRPRFRAASRRVAPAEKSLSSLRLLALKRSPSRNDGHKYLRYCITLRDRPTSESTMFSPEPNRGEVKFNSSELLVSKTCPRGMITYVSRAFEKISGFSEAELLGAPHSLVRHPAMPRSIFDLVWETIQDGQEIFAFVVNLTKTGEHYWVLAHITPDFEPGTGRILGYHSSRRVASAGAIAEIGRVYRDLLMVEQRCRSTREACTAGREALKAMHESTEQTYEQFIFDLYTQNINHAYAA
jgi:PAS domain S-box-containing protein